VGGVGRCDGLVSRSFRKRERASDPNGSRRSRGDRSWTRTRELTLCHRDMSSAHNRSSNLPISRSFPCRRDRARNSRMLNVAADTPSARRGRSMRQSHLPRLSCRRERDGRSPPCARPVISRRALTRDCWSDDAKKTEWGGPPLTRDLFTGDWIEPDAVGDALPRRRPDGEPHRLTVSPGVADLSRRVFGQPDPVAVV